MANVSYRLSTKPKVIKDGIQRYEVLARQRDIFIFHSFIGCRVSDLWAMTKKNVVDGNFIEYIPRKTADGRPVTVRVPLTKSAKEILERYKDCPGGKLLPFVAQQQYNEDIKEMLMLAKIDRIVTVLNSLTTPKAPRPSPGTVTSTTTWPRSLSRFWNQVPTKKTTKQATK